MSSESGDTDGHPVIQAAGAVAQRALVVDEEHARQVIDIGAVTHHSSASSSPRDEVELEFNDSRYFLPHDQSEQERLDLQHQIYLTTLDGKLNLAPMTSDVRNVLDIGTGSGIWAVDFARRYPSSQVIGFDLSTYIPPYVPSNLNFQVHDAEKPWPFNQIFDYIHGRSLSSCFDCPSLVIKHAFQALKPGSYLEMQDCILPMRSVDDTYAGSFTQKWQSLIIQGAAKLGRDITQVKNYKTYMEEAGFVDVAETHFQWPLGPWAVDRRLKAIGVLFREDMDRLVDNFSARLLHDGLGMKNSEVNAFLAQVRTEWKVGKVHIYLPILVVHGRKPE